MKAFNEKEFEYFMIQIGIKVGYYRRKLGWTQQELAEKADISISSIGQLESPNMVYTPSMKALYKIACAFKIDFLKLVDIEE